MGAAQFFPKVQLRCSATLHSDVGTNESSIGREDYDSGGMDRLSSAPSFLAVDSEIYTYYTRDISLSSLHAKLL